MSNIAELIKDLRNKTGAGFLDCKKALSENQNDLESAIEFLRKKGLAKASKKTSREAKEGAIGIYNNNSSTVILKINTETDFAAKSDTFLSFLDDIGKFALNKIQNFSSKDEFLSLNYNNNLISDYFSNMIAKIGENLILNDLIVFKENKNHIKSYVHNSYKENIGKIIAIIEYEANKIDEKIENLSKNLCMHIAAMKPESLDINDLSDEAIDKEKKIQKELILNSGKPSNIVDKILEGKMKKFYSEVTLMNQSFILDQDKTVKTIINEYSKEYGFKLISYKLVSLQ